MQSNHQEQTALPVPLNLQDSLRLLTGQQIDYYIVQISLLALQEPSVSQWMVDSMTHLNFYLKYRHLLPSLLNGQLSPSQSQKLNALIQKMDERYINGQESKILTQKQIMKKPLKKANRLSLNVQTQKVFQILDRVSSGLALTTQSLQKRAVFEQGIQQVNNILKRFKEQGQDYSASESQQQQKKIQGVCFVLQNKLQSFTGIDSKDSYPIQTKNRHPLVLNCNFGLYLYKNDDQLSHQIIAMEWVQYLNTLLGKPYIVPYQILPQKYGALYKFIENSNTVHQVKAMHATQSLATHYQMLCQQKGTESILTRFAQTYSGFCLLQYLLDVKDRNNANIMIGQDGSIFHIDLTFIFGSGPGGISFQSAPFKCPKEYIKLMGGFNSDYFRKFQTLMVQHLTKLFQSRQEIFYKIQIKCFKGYSQTDFRRKFPTKLQKVKSLVQDLIDKSHDNWKTTKYDDYQFKTNNILK